MIKQKVLSILVVFGLLLFISCPVQAEEDICDLCDESSQRINFGSSLHSSQAWYDLSSVFRMGNRIVLRTDNPWDKPDRPNIIFYASFTSKQSLKLSSEADSCPCENQGDKATLSAKLYQITNEREVVKLAAKLRSDGVPLKLWPDLMGPYIYRIKILAPDYGLYSTNLLSLSTAADYAIGRARVDHYRRDDTERAKICNYVGSVKKPAPEGDNARGPALPPKRAMGSVSPLMAVIK